MASGKFGKELERDSVEEEVDSPLSSSDTQNFLCFTSKLVERPCGFTKGRAEAERAGEEAERCTKAGGRLLSAKPKITDEK